MKGEGTLTNVEDYTGMTETPTLRELAKAVNARTPGPWRTASNRPFGPWVDADTTPLAADGLPVLSRNWKEICLNAAYIAHANPAAVLALYEERDALDVAAEKQRRELIAFADALRDEAVKDLRAEGDQLRAALREAQQDTVRLKWLDAQWMDGIHIEVCGKGNADVHVRGVATLYSGAKKEWERPTVREAIDAARGVTP